MRPAGDRGCGKPAVVGRISVVRIGCTCLCTSLIDLLQHLVVERTLLEGVGPGEQERPRIGAGQRDAQLRDRGPDRDSATATPASG